MDKPKAQEERIFSEDDFKYYTDTIVRIMKNAICKKGSTPNDAIDELNSFFAQAISAERNANAEKIKSLESKLAEAEKKIYVYEGSEHEAEILNKQHQQIAKLEAEAKAVRSKTIEEIAKYHDDRVAHYQELMNDAKEKGAKDGQPYHQQHLWEYQAMRDEHIHSAEAIRALNNEKGEQHG